MNQTNPTQLLRDAIKRHPSYVSGDDDLTTMTGLMKTAAMVLDRIADDRIPQPIKEK